jgi:pantoate--beta-alanine ligase
VFLPRTEEIYKRKIHKNIKIHRKKNVLCGKFRKGHFEGVIDVIDRFLSLINPKYIFLGEKDFQQLFLIKNYVKNRFKVKVVSCKTVRDKNYVALSSRNFLLSKKNLSTAGKIAKKLKSFKNSLKNNQNFKKKINDLKTKLIEKYNVKFEYLELRNEKDLSVFKKKNKFRLFIGYYINKVRLIDNF